MRLLPYLGNCGELDCSYFFYFLLNSQFFQVAERIGREGKRLHFDVQVSAFDDFVVGEYGTGTVLTGIGDKNLNHTRQRKHKLRRKFLNIFFKVSQTLIKVPVPVSSLLFGLIMQISTFLCLKKILNVF
jgi:hypothetical protein